MSVLLPGLDNRCRNVVSLFGTGNVLVGDLSSGVVVPGFKDALLAFAEPQRFYYTLAPRDGAWGQWENGVGYLSVISDATYLVRERVLTSSNSNALVNFAPTVGDLWASAPAELLRNCQHGYGNVLINGGFDVFQRQTPTTATARTDGQYGPDRAYVLTQTAAINCEQVAGGTNSLNALKLTQNQATAQRFGCAQVTEAANCRHLRGQQVIMQGIAKASAAQALRLALVEWTGTANAPTRDVVNNWASGTYTPGNFFLGSNLTIAAVGSFTPAAATRTPFELRATLSNNCNNLYAVIWTEGTAAQNFTLEIEQWGVYPGTERRLWLPEPLGDTIQRCRRYYQKSYELHVAPASAVTLGMVGSLAGGAGALMGLTFKFPVSMRTTPTIAVYDNAGNVGKCNEAMETANVTAVMDLASTEGARILKNSGTIGQVAFHYTADAEL